MIKGAIRAVRGASETERRRQSLGRLGRLSFAFRIIAITGTAFALEFLGDALLGLAQLPHVIYVLQRVIVFGALGTILLRGVDQRLLDTGLARWYRYPFIAAWLLSVSLSTAWPSAWRIGLGLFLLVLILGCSIPGRPLPAALVATGPTVGPEPTGCAPRQQRQPTLFNTPVSFLRSLLTLACLWLPLIRLENVSVGGIGVWLARPGFCILSFVWFFILIGRLNDAGRLPRKRYGVLLTVLVLLLGTPGHMPGVGWPTHLRDFLLPSYPFVAATLEAWLRHVNGYEKLAVFLVVQIPLAFWPSEPRLAAPATESVRPNKRLWGRTTNAKTSDLVICGRFEFLRILFVIVLFWIPFIYMDRASGGGIGTWIARVAYALLVFFWMNFAHGRFVDAGIAHSEYNSQYVLVVATATLMPLAVHWVNGYGALVIFAVIQAPTAFLKSKPSPELQAEEPTLASG